MVNVHSLELHSLTMIHHTHHQPHHPPAAYPPNEMLFMDFRRHHTGVWDSSANLLTVGPHTRTPMTLGSAEEQRRACWELPGAGLEVLGSFQALQAPAAHSSSGLPWLLVAGQHEQP